MSNKEEEVCQLHTPCDTLNQFWVLHSVLRLFNLRAAFLSQFVEDEFLMREKMASSEKRLD
jgi:hypothetical protein